MNRKSDINKIVSMFRQSENTLHIMRLSKMSEKLREALNKASDEKLREILHHFKSIEDFNGETKR